MSILDAINWRCPAVVSVQCTKCGAWCPGAAAEQTRDGTRIVALPDGFNEAGECPTCNGLGPCPECSHLRPIGEFADATWPSDDLRGRASLCCATCQQAAARKTALAEQRLRDATKTEETVNARE
jgi:hypothetical protein